MVTPLITLLEGTHIPIIELDMNKVLSGFNNAAALHLNNGAVNLMHSDPSVSPTFPLVLHLWMLKAFGVLVFLIMVQWCS